MSSSRENVSAGRFAWVKKKKALKGRRRRCFKGFPDAKLDHQVGLGARVTTWLPTGTWTGTNTGDIPSMKLEEDRQGGHSAVRRDRTSFAAGQNQEHLAVQQRSIRRCPTRP